MAYGWREEAVEARLRPVLGVRSRAKLLDEPRRADDGLENLGEECAVAADPINGGGDSHELALRVELDVAAVTPVDRAVHVEDRRNHAVLVDALRVPDDIGFGLFDEAGPQQGQRLRGAVANPGAVVIAGTGLEGVFRGIDEDERRLRLDRVAHLRGRRP